MSQYVVFEIVTYYAMIEYIFELTRNETAISTILLGSFDPPRGSHL